jgi:uncharacterized membrane protein
MGLLAAGLVVFIGIHLVPVVTPLRARLSGALGEGRYKIAFSIAAAVGLVAIVAGWWRAGPGQQLFGPSPLAQHVAPYAMVVAFILLATSHAPSHLRAAVKHPMLIGVMIWSLVHLFANGDTRGTLLFGAFLAFAIVDLVSAAARHAVARFEPRARADVISVVAGTLVALLVMAFHRVLFGHAVVPFSA